MWSTEDRQAFLEHMRQNKGQIHEDPFADEIERYASDPAYHTFLEVGTWNGLGSTQSFAKGFRQRTDPYVFYSLECNEEKSMHAASLYRDEPHMQILNEVLWNEEPADFYTTFPECLTDERFKQWNTIDLLNMKACPVFLARTDLPAIFDVVLLDGGEFTTYYDYQCIKERCKVLLLDDTLTEKCKRIVEELERDASWAICARGVTRNGYVVAEKRGAY